jgi:3-dehydroquinate synthase
VILFSKNTAETLQNWLDKNDYDKVFLLTDANTQQQCLPQVALIANHVISIPAGEENKNLNSAQIIWTELAKNGASRKSLLVNLGGGMVTDIGSFCASTYLRGIDFIQIPTSLLAMVDAAIGGKTGIDFLSYKNFIGTFTNAKCIIINPAFLQTLPQKEIINGWAEVVKHAIISGYTLFNEIQTIPDISNLDLWEKIIDNNIQIKTQIVEKDPNELNIRKKLNLGHTIGHGLESFFIASNTITKHGYCIAAGIVMESYIAVKKQLLPEKQYEEIAETVLRIFPKMQLNNQWFDEILKWIAADKKNHHGKIHMSVPAAIGNVIEKTEVSTEEIQNALFNYFSNANQRKF